MSLRTRLLAAVAAVAFVALAAADVVTYTQLKTFLFHQVDNSLETAHGAIEVALEGHVPTGLPGIGALGGAGTGSEHDPGEPLPTGSTFCSTVANRLAPGTFVAVRKPSGAPVTSDVCSALESGGTKYSPALPAKVTGYFPTGPFHELTVYFTARSTSSGGPDFRVRISRLAVGSLRGDQLVLAVPIGADENTLHNLLGIELAVSGAALVAAVLLGWWLVRFGLLPLRRVERTAAAIAGGDLAHRVPGEGRRTEVGRVALALNVMLEHIQQAFAARDRTESQLRESEERLRRFVGDASHELRTPVAAVSAYAQLFERVGGLAHDDVDRIMAGIRRETGRMGHLVEDLLLLAHLDEGQPLADEPVELVDLLAGAMETARTVGPEWPVRLVASEAVEVVGDHVRLRQVVDNLLGNVRAHTPAGTATTVRVARAGDEAVIEVADEGPGITEGQAARLFERFYRADASRSRASGGAGLGLAIVTSIVEAHYGTVSARPGAAGGAVFTVRLPLVPGG